MTQAILITLSILPLALFIFYLLYIDAFSLTKKSTLTYTILWGIICCIILKGLGYLFNLENQLLMISAIEEFLKGFIILWLVSRKKVVLVGDATIYGSAVGAGFGMMENILEVIASNEMVFSEAIFKGFEAAVMHIGCTSTLAAMLIMVSQGKYGHGRKRKRIMLLISFIAATFIHYIHCLNDVYELIHPMILTALLVVYFAFSKWSIFVKNAKFIHEWVDSCINNEIALLGAIKQGKLATTNAGKYLLTLKDNYKPEVFFDMCCYISEYLELSIAAKSNLILKEAGMPIIKNDVNKNRILELNALRKRIGKAGEYSLSPIVKIGVVDKWVMDSLL